MRDSALPHPHLACVAVQAAWFFAFSSPTAACCKPCSTCHGAGVGGDGRRMWDAGHKPCLSFLKVDYSGVRQNLSSIRRKPGMVMGSSRPLGQKGGSESVAEEKVGGFPGTACPLCPQAPGFWYLQGNSCCQMDLSDTMLREII